MNNGERAAIGALGVLVAFASAAGSSRTPPEQGPPEPEPEPYFVEDETTEKPSPRLVQIGIAWDDYILRTQATHDNADRVAIDKAMEAEELPPGYFWDQRGRLVSPDLVMEHLDHYEPTTYDDAVDLAQALYDEQLAKGSAFYVRRLIVHLKSHRAVDVEFDPPARVRLVPTPYAELTYMPDSSTDYDYMSPTWWVDLRENRSELQGLDIDPRHRFMFETMDILLVDEED